ncbi:MAG: DUF4190 domain-containing protein [Actinomycetes bacterium]
MSNQPSQGPDHQGNGSPWPSYQGPEQNQPPSGQGQYRQPQYGQTQFGPSPYNPGQHNYGQYGQTQYNPAQYYGQPSYYGRPVEPKTLSIASMVCGIASVIVGWLLVPQLAAVITGHLALRREPSGKGMSITGLVLGYLCLLGYGALWLLLIIGLTIAGTAGSNTGTF